MKSKRTPVDYKDLNAPNGQIYRLMQCPSDWHHIYKTRIEYFGGYKSSIIFPEQLLSLRQASIFAVSFRKSELSVNASIEIINSYRVYSMDRNIWLDTIESILEAEENKKETITIGKNNSWKINGKYNGQYVFNEVIGMKALFSSRKDAKAWAKSKVKSW